MQIFGKFSATLHIARRLSCNYNARRYTSLVPTCKKSNKELLLLPQHQLYEQPQRTQQQQQQLQKYQNVISDLPKQLYLNDMARQQEYHIIKYRKNDVTLIVMNLASTSNNIEPIKVMLIPTRSIKDSLGAALMQTQSKEITAETSPTTLNAVANEEKLKDVNNTSKSNVSTFVIMNLIRGYENFHNGHNYTINGLGKLYGNPIVLNHKINHDIIKSNLIISKFYSTNAKQQQVAGKSSKTANVEKSVNSHVICVAEGGKGCISPGNAQYPSYEPVATNKMEESQLQGATSIEPSKTEAKIPQKKCNPDYCKASDMFQQEVLLKCDAYSKALQNAIKLKEQKPIDKPIETKSDTIIVSCGETTNAIKYPMYIPNPSRNNANATSAQRKNTLKDSCKTIPETQCSQQIGQDETSNQTNKPRMKAAAAYPNNSGAMICRSAIPQSKLFNSLPQRSAIQFKMRGMHAAKKGKGGKNDKCKKDPCIDEEEVCPNKCDDVFARVRHNKQVMEERKKTRKLVGCPPKKENQVKSTGVCAHVIPKKISSGKDDKNNKKYHTLSHMGQVFKLKSKLQSQTINEAGYHNFAVPMNKTTFKMSLKPRPVFKPRIESDLIGDDALVLNRPFTKTSFALKESKASPCTSKEKGKGKDKKKKPNPCEPPEKAYTAKCNADPCADKAKKKDADADKKKKSDTCKKQTEEKKKDVNCKKMAEARKKKADSSAKKKEDPCKKKEDPCKKKEDPCKKKEDPCKKKEDPCKKKEDPCKKKEDAKKKADPCKKKDDAKKKEDPCKKKDDAKKKADPCKKKEDAKKKADPCKKKDDAKKKEDPCKKKDDGKKKNESGKKLCGTAQKETKPNCKKYSSLALCHFLSTPLKSNQRNFCTFNIRKQYNLFNMPFKRHMYQAKLVNVTSFIQRNHIHTTQCISSISNVIDPMKSMPLNGKRSIATYKIPKTFMPHNFGVNRYYSSGKGGKSDKDGKSSKKKISDDCGTENLVRPSNRKPNPNARPRDRLRENCFKTSDSSGGGGCRASADNSLCKDPSKTACKGIPKQNMKNTKNTNKGRK